MIQPKVSPSEITSPGLIDLSSSRITPLTRFDTTFCKPKPIPMPMAPEKIVKLVRSKPIDFILRFWIRDPTGGLTNVRGAAFLALWDALKAAEIEIPYPRRDVTIVPGFKGD